MSSGSSSSSTAKVLSDRVPLTWWQGLLLALLALVGFDLAINFIFGVALGLSQAIWGETSLLVREARANSIALNFGLFALSRGLALVFIYKLFRRRGRGWGDMGLRKFSIPRFVGLLIISVVIFLLASYGIFTLLDQTAPGLNLEQEQDIIFTGAHTHAELIMSFVALVIIAPVAEEVLFRGILFPTLMRRFGVYMSAILTSAVFGAIHAQVNVMIVTFVMSLLMVWLYYRLKSLWPAIMFHSLKNVVAFFTIFELF